MKHSGAVFLNVSRLRLLLFLVWSVSVTKLAAQDKTEQSNGDIYLADPAILYHKGTYYLYGTVGASSDLGFTVYTSKDSKTWEGPKGVNAGYALRKGDAYGQGRFWAPHVFHHQNKFYMAYAADENIAIASSDSPLGPFIQTKKEALAAPVKQIDPYIFIDDDGKKYLYHVRLTNGNRLFVAEINDDFSAIKPQTLRECISAVEPWENTANVPWPVAEGPAILKHKNFYYFVYSANDFRNPDYAVGYAVSNNPYGPWKKHPDNPIISKKNLNWNGTGHGDFFKDKKGNLQYVLHTHYDDTKVSPRKTAIIKMRFTKDKTSSTDKLTVDSKSFFFPAVKICTSKVKP